MAYKTGGNPEIHGLHIQNTVWTRFHVHSVAERELLASQGIISEKEGVIQSPINQLKEAELSSVQRESNFDYAWNRSRGRKRKIKYLTGQLDIYERNRSFFSRRNPYRSCSPFN